MSSSEQPPVTFGESLRSHARFIAEELKTTPRSEGRATLAATLRDLVIAAEVVDRQAAAAAGDSSEAAQFGTEVMEVMRRHLLDSRVQYVKAPDGQVLDVAQATGPQIAAAYWQVVGEWQQAAARVPHVVNEAVGELSRIRELYAGRDDRASRRQHDLLTQAIARIEMLGVPSGAE